MEYALDRQTFKTGIERSSGNKFSAIIIATIISIFFVPVILADRPYIDDMGRTFSGDAGWSVSGRLLADWVMVAVNFGGPLTDLSPMTQIFSLLVSVLSAYLVYIRIRSEGVSEYISAFSSSLVVINPFFLQNISYKFDCLPMSIALLAAVLASATRTRSVGATIYGTLLVFSVFSLYQAAINVTISLAIFFAIVDVSRGTKARQSIAVLLNIAIRLVLGFILYRIIIINIFLSDVGNTNSRLADIPSLYDDISNIFTRLHSGLNSIYYSFNDWQLFVIKLSCVVAQVYVVVLSTRYLFLSRDRGRYYLAVLAALGPLLIFVMSFGFLALLRDPIVDPRVFIAFGCFLAVTAWLTGMAANELCLLPFFRGIGGPARTLVPIVLIAPLVLLCLIISAAFGVAEKEQRLFDIALTADISAAAKSVGARSSDYLVVQGTMPMALFAEKQVAKYPILKNLVPLYLRNGSIWGGIMLDYYGFRMKAPGFEAGKWEYFIENSKGLPSDVTSDVFSMVKIDDALILRFKQE